MVFAPHETHDLCLTLSKHIITIWEQVSDFRRFAGDLFSRIKWVLQIPHQPRRLSRPILSDYHHLRAGQRNFMTWFGSSTPDFTEGVYLLYRKVHHFLIFFEKINIFLIRTGVKSCQFGSILDRFCLFVSDIKQNFGYQHQKGACLVWYLLGGVLNYY